MLKIERVRGPSLPQKIRMIKLGKREGVISFIMPDKSIIKENINEKFLEHKKIGTIITDLYAICGDKGAETFII